MHTCTIYENASCGVDCDVPGAMLPIIHYCCSDKHILSDCAAAFAVQSCPTLVVCDACTVPNIICVYFSMRQTRARVKKDCKTRLNNKAFFKAFALAR